MRVSYKWLKELVNIDDISFEKLVSDISLYSIEVETTEEVTSASPCLVIGHVLSKEKHPNADKLSVCLVDVGSEVLQIVCGAPNVAAGQKIMLAKAGTKLPGGDIKVSEIRGVKSNGMICSLQEVGLESKYIPEEFAHGIYVLDDDAPIGEDALEYLELNDQVVELGLTPNRMDLLSMRGVSQDVAAMYSTTVNPIEYELKESNKKATDEIEVSSTTPKCIDYYARVIKNVEIKESPNFLKARLIAAGVRPINNVVDITNYILMLFGQPLHAFDQQTLGNKIVVRMAEEGEKVVTLDEVERTLSADDIVITDGVRPVCLAGVMGCSNTEVTNETKNVVLEAAVFDSLSVRKTSARLGLRSESSTRFERGVNVNSTLEALNYACYLLQTYAGGEVLEGYANTNGVFIEDKVINITKDDVVNYLGIDITLEEISDICSRLAFNNLIDGEILSVYVPNRRMDISIKQDLIEEIIRIYGYNNLKETIPATNTTGALTPSQRLRRRVKHHLASLGLKEVITYTLINPTEDESFDILYQPETAPIKLLHPMSEERSVVRRSLIPSLLTAAKFNNARKMGDLALFEMGNVHYFKNQEEVLYDMHLAGYLNGTFGNESGLSQNRVVDFYLVKGIINSVENLLGLKLDYKKLDQESSTLHPERTALIYFKNELVGFVGALHPEFAKKESIDGYVFELDLDKLIKHSLELSTISFTQIPKVPAVTRDLAIVVKDTDYVGEMIEAIYKTDKEAISQVSVFDIYKGMPLAENERSVALRITLVSDVTLTEDVIQTKINKIIKMLEFRFKAYIRS